MRITIQIELDDRGRSNVYIAKENDLSNVFHDNTYPQYAGEIEDHAVGCLSKFLEQNPPLI